MMSTAAERGQRRQWSVAGGTSRKRYEKAFRAVWEPLISIVGLMALWEGAVRLFSVPSYLLPPPSAVLSEIKDNASILLEHSLVTLWEIVIGFAVALLGGMLIGVVVGSFRAIERAIMPIILFFQVVPKSALAPLLIVWVGVGIASKIALVFLMAFFPIVVQMIAGIRSVSEQLIFLTRSTRARWRDVFLHVSLPHSLPYLFAGIKVSLTLAVVGAVVAEFIASSSGIGYLLLVAFGRLDTALVLAGLTMITVLAMVLYGLASVAERLIIPWHASQRLRKG